MIVIYQKDKQQRRVIRTSFSKRIESVRVQPGNRPTMSNRQRDLL